MDEKSEYDMEIALFLHKHIPEPGKIIMSNNPYAALETGNHWLLAPVDYPMRTIKYAQTQAADYFLAEEYPFAWVVLPPDWGDYLLSPLSKPGLNYIASYPEYSETPVAVLYKVEQPKPAPKTVPNIIMLIAGPGWKAAPELAAKGVRFDNMIESSTDPKFNLASIFSSNWQGEFFITATNPLYEAIKFRSAIKKLPGPYQGQFYPSKIFYQDPIWDLYFLPPRNNRAHGQEFQACIGDRKNPKSLGQ